ncbi:2-amino-4-hydroxy-6-hydroxymethyldihydropteridine diphosphokinase [Phytohalomonas tamaricis]|uniref:2-amino-4-hydroxy-6- hydroxymethyldihydropteridine diphosphokinase n=1 Tax=Phytohalomonas tamaricis TaxID=2081032 RepID=UPI000D0B3BCC|nr:2-amino-4-hydroxy-6-hydroxymethyldihydropteridine diphosphokinase [Phytohalomonas tamaricis]
MAHVLVSLGSNIDREHHIRTALDALYEQFGELAISRVFESEPVGFASQRNFYNLVVGFSCPMAVGKLQRWCKNIEFANGREPNAPKFSSRSLDIDILCVDDLSGDIDGVSLPRSEIGHNAFVLQPLAELFPESRHPLSGQRYIDMWKAFNPGAQRLWPVDFFWQGKQVSRAD